MNQALFSVETQAFLKALASETRQQIMQEFTDGGSLTVGEIAQRCRIGQSTASEQLAILRHGGLVAAARHGKQVRYRADPAHIGAQLEVLGTCLAHCCSAPPDASSSDTGDKVAEPDRRR